MTDVAKQATPALRELGARVKAELAKRGDATQDEWPEYVAALDRVRTLERENETLTRTLVLEREARARLAERVAQRLRKPVP